MSVAQLIEILNDKMRNFAIHFLDSEKIRTQLNSIDNSIYRWFWKWLKKKYGSKPKLLTFLHKNFLNFDNFFASEKKVLIPLSKIASNDERSFFTRVPSKELLKKNVFLSSEKYQNFKLSKSRSTALNFQLRNRRCL